MFYENSIEEMSKKYKNSLNCYSTNKYIRDKCIENISYVDKVMNCHKKERFKKWRVFNVLRNL